MSASCAFMLPVATIPNAVVFGTGEILSKNGTRGSCSQSPWFHGHFYNLLSLTLLKTPMKYISSLLLVFGSVCETPAQERPVKKRRIDPHG